MASRMLNCKPVTRNTVESDRVRVPVTLPASCFSANPRIKHCNRPNQTMLMLQNHANFGRSEAPSRFMYFQDGSWVDFNADVVAAARSAFMARKPVIDLSIDGSKCLFDFMRMLQTDFETGHQRSVAWIDESGECFFPKTFVGEEGWNQESSENPKIEIEIRIDGNSVKRKREEEAREVVEEENRKVVEEEEVSSSHKQEGPAKRLCTTPPPCRWPNAVLLREEDESYSVVKNFFRSGIDLGHTITAIHQCTRTGHLEKARYEVFMKQAEIMLASRGASNMVYAWHGVSADAVSSILAHGFAVPAQYSRSEGYGVGVHLSPVDAPHSSHRLLEADANGENHLVLCRVILGNVEQVEAGSEQFRPSSFKFDSGSDNPIHPKWYVVWCANMNSHILPEYVVSYKSPSRISAPFTTSTGVKYTVAELFAKMKAILPPPKIEEVLALYNTFRAGLLVKGDFIKQLRSIAGDKMLLSAMKEIRGC